MSRGKGVRAGLNREIVLAEAIRLLTEEGYSALSMRRLADRLGVTPTAIYSHVSDRGDLIDGMLDIVLQGVRIPRSGAWDARLVELMRRVREAIAAHPDLVPHYLNRKAIGSEARRIGGSTLNLLAETDLSPMKADYAMRALMIYTIGSAAIDLSSRSASDREGRDAVQGNSVETFLAGLRWFVRGLAEDSR